jgi:undecaprenyl diphosphate synthase
MSQDVPARLHVAIIMDGNGRWATSRGFPRVEGHRRGARTVERTVEAAARLGLGTLTLYALSADNWRRPADEIQTLLHLFERYLHKQIPRAIAHGIRFSLIGRRDRLPPALVARAESGERDTARCAGLHLRLAIDYSARDALWQAARQVEAEPAPCRETFDRAVRSGRGVPDATPDVDLVIRTGGERRLSDFLLWESAYAELWFTDTKWPDFTEAEFARALAEFAARDRRFGGLPGTASAAGTAGTRNALALVNAPFVGKS